VLVARVSRSYPWSDNDSDGLPNGATIALWEEGRGSLPGFRSEPLQLSPDVRGDMKRNSMGSFEWHGSAERHLGAFWSFPGTHRFRLPLWRVVVSEPRRLSLAPMEQFSHDLPLYIGLCLGLVLLVGLNHIRQSVAPLRELQKGTRRVAAHDFGTPVVVTSGDELQELAAAFNAMSVQLSTKFRSLETAGEIDRAVLSSVDTSAIVTAVLDRIPEIYPCDRLSITVLAPGTQSRATTWIDLYADGAERSSVASSPEAPELRSARENPERILFESGTPLPGYLAHFVGAAAGSVVEACPLHNGGRLLGVLAIRRTAENASAEAQFQMRRLADQVAVALSNAQMVDQVRFLAFYDSLTRLPNRVLYKERLTQAIVRAQRSRLQVAICFLDLDHFSRINDTLGHEMGDRLVQEVAGRLHSCCREGTVARYGAESALAEVARLGGDEFTVILPDLEDPQDAARVARRLLDTFKQPFRLGTHEVFVTTSIGIAIYPHDGTEIEDLLKNADVAMYHAKEQGRNTYQLYSASMNAEAMARLQMEQRLRKAVEGGEFTVWYQPIVNLKSRTLAGAEALVRWADPERGLVSPGEFISLCEESGLIVPLGEWILRTVCAQVRQWEADGLGAVRVSVNLSARQLRHPGIVDTVEAVLQESGLAPEYLCLELTESMLMEPSGVTGGTIRALADLGVHLAIDDFGTGYSSLSYLKNFPVSTLKIDRSFVENINSSHDDAAITTAIIALASAMELEVVAEGVETEEQAAFLTARGCQKIQGYLVGKPGPAFEFEALLRDRPKARVVA
jgi:diguanylate cyclase (GGDEF)-like protein